MRTNLDRALRGRDLAALALNGGEENHLALEDYETGLSDALADLMHFARRYEIDFGECLMRAQRHHMVEATYDWDEEPGLDPKEGSEGDEAREWVLSRPPGVQEVIRRFPPACTVRTKEGVELNVPAPGLLAQVVSYREVGDKVFVIARGRLRGEGPFFDAECNPDDLELDAEGTVTRETVERWLS